MNNSNSMSLGLYISVPFCRTKCSYCNFASDVFSKSAYENYVARLLEDVADSRQLASDLGCALEESADSIYLGGGTPSILEAAQLLRLFAAVRNHFAITPDAEITVECAPGTLTPALIETLQQCGVNRVSLGVQSFVDQEAQSVGRLHKRTTVLQEIARLRDAGLANINIDLIAGLPHQTADSWAYSISEMIATGVPHASVYMLEVDEDSRLGRELIAGGARYHAHFVPNDDATADFYQQAREMLAAAGIVQYEISNFARAVAASDAGHSRSNESRHNLKYWTRQPYVGFGVDAHSMLVAEDQNEGRYEGEGYQAIRFATPDSLDAYMNRAPRTVTPVSGQAAIEESLFLGLRLNRGIDIPGLQQGPRPEMATVWEAAIRQSVLEGLLEQQGATLRLTARGRLLSNEVFARFLAEEKVGTGHVNPR
ncbi:MAG TPA: radical SAM family heme chaperone HemW [Terriglobales bacterium]|nr:radical SAM family heme chaperone HemW [Terriglobales bacterium]